MKRFLILSVLCLLLTGCGGENDDNHFGLTNPTGPKPELNESALLPTPKIPKIGIKEIADETGYVAPPAWVASNTNDASVTFHFVL